jgi:CPA2 family monovalent cation:H+ antiporter-2
MPALVGAALAMLLITVVMRRLRQPHVIAYLLGGLLLGPAGLGIFRDEHLLARVGGLGVILLLFFVGLEVSLPRLARNWRVACIGTFLQIACSVGCVWGLGAWLDWELPRIVLLGFAISLSSTAVVVSLLRARGTLDSEQGHDALTVLLAQDIALVPMMIGLEFLAGRSPEGSELAKEVLGGVLILGLLVWAGRRGSVPMPWRSLLQKDHELQVFAAFILCFGLALVTGLLGLSSALGAFVAGMLVGMTRETEWIHRSLEPFRVVTVAIFFISIGMLVDLEFLVRQWSMVTLLVAMVLLTNTLINAGILRVLGRSWRSSIYVGAILAQIGEFSFLLAAVGRESAIITEVAYQATLAVIIVTMALSPAWIGAFGRLTRAKLDTELSPKGER